LTAGFLAGSSTQFTQHPIFDRLFNPQKISKYYTQKNKNRNIRLHFEEKLNYHPKYTPFSPIFTSTSPWTQPAIRYDLTSIPKSDIPSFFLSELHSVLEEFPDHIHLYIDGLSINYKTACAYLAGSTYSFRLYNSSSIFTTKQVAFSHVYNPYPSIFSVTS